ncbi:MAG: alpha/beta hydrolase [Actinomycetota bacterium]|nr:alpha/beta hydrolase [Actinomycetota bacterium]
MTAPAIHRHRAIAFAGVAAVAASAAYAHGRSRRPSWAPGGGRLVQTSTLSARVLGESGPPILLVHGLIASGLYWGAAYDRLADRHRLVVPDLLGFGRSPRPTSGFGPDGHADALLACLDDLGIDEPVVIGSHSLGSLVALRLAARHPERVTAVVAFGPPIYPDQVTARNHVSATSPMGRLFVLPGRSAERACGWVCSHKALAAWLAVLTHPGVPPAIADDALEHTWSSYSQTLQHVILAGGAASWLNQVACSIDLVAGDADPVVDHAYLRRLAASHGNVTFREKPGRHNLPLADPTGCMTLLEAPFAGLSGGDQAAPSPIRGGSRAAPG